MRYRTELMQAILTNETAQDIIDYVSQIYGDSYVGLWVYQVMGTILGEIQAMARDLRTEVNPGTAILLLDQWEDSLGLPPDHSLTVEQRQARLMQKRLFRAPASPSRIESIVQTVTGFPARVTENVAPYTFSVEVFCDGAAIDFDKVLNSLQRLKPCHQQMQFFITATVGIQIKGNRTTYPFPYPMAGTYPQDNITGVLDDSEIDVSPEGAAHPFEYSMTGEHLAGTLPDTNTVAAITGDGLTATVETSSLTIVFPLCGEDDD